MSKISVGLREILDNKQNYIINGNFDFWQRGTSFTAIADNDYSADRWQAKLSGATANMTRESFTENQTDVPNFPKYFLRYAVTTSNDNARIEHKIEDARTLAGDVCSLSFWAKGTNPNGGVLRIVLDRNYGGSIDYGIAETHTLVLTSSWQKFDFTFNVPTIPSGKSWTEDSYLSVRIGSGSDTSTNAWTLDLAQVMLNEGPNPANFSRAGGTIGGELALCQRYYQKSYNLTTVPGTSQVSGSYQTNIIRNTSSLNNWSIAFGVRMRGTPDVDMYSTDGTGPDNYYNEDTGPATSPAATISDEGETGFTAGPTIGTDQNQADRIRFHWTADAEL